MLFKRRHHFLPIKFICQEISFLHFQVCSRTQHPLCCCPRSGLWELSLTWHLLVTIFSHPSWDIENPQIPDASSELLGGEGRYGLFPSCDTSCWRNTCTILFIPQGLTRFLLEQLFMDPQLSVGLRYAFNKELAWETGPGIRPHVALRIWNSNSLSMIKSFLEVRLTYWDFLSGFLQISSGESQRLQPVWFTLGVEFRQLPPFFFIINP